jgi:hypothetical protein
MAQLVKIVLDPPSLSIFKSHYNPNFSGLPRARKRKDCAIPRPQQAFPQRLPSSCPIKRHQGTPLSCSNLWKHKTLPGYSPVMFQSMETYYLWTTLVALTGDTPMVHKYRSDHHRIIGNHSPIAKTTTLTCQSYLP